MNKNFKSFVALLKASLKMYFRNRGAVFFTLVFPLALLAVFGFLSRGGGTTLKLNLTNYSSTPLSREVVETLKSVKTFELKELSEADAAAELGKGDADLQIIIPENFGAVSANGTIKPASITTHYNEGKPQNGQIANLVIGQIISGINSKATGAPEVITLTSSGVKTNNLGYFDFILPGLLAMVIMQAGLFGVAFAFVSFKASGALRRIQATPVHPLSFIFAQAVTRLIITLLTVAILIGCGIAFFDFHMLGSYVEFTLITILGSLIFLGFGFAIAGYAKDENQVAPLANIVQLPMLLLSGIFFPRDSFPSWLARVTDFFPLTYLSDSLRHIANEGAHITALGGDVLGLIIWIVAVFALAISVFRWE